MLFQFSLNLFGQSYPENFCFILELWGNTLKQECPRKGNIRHHEFAAADGDEIHLAAADQLFEVRQSRTISYDVITLRRRIFQMRRRQ